MKNRPDLTQAALQDMKNKNIDVDLTLAILDNYNAGAYDHFKPVTVTGIPEVNGEDIVSLDEHISLSLPTDICRQRLAHLGWKGDLNTVTDSTGSTVNFSRPALYTLGTALLPLLSYGVLNGGSATSFLDSKKNSNFDSTLFRIYQPHFEKSARKYAGMSKGLTPAFYHPDGSEGPTFMELKIRHLLFRALEYQRLPRTLKSESAPAPLFPMIQMTSIRNNEEIQSAMTSFYSGPYLEALFTAAGISGDRMLTGVQPLLGAFTHSQEGIPKKVFTRAYGKKDTVLPLPGGHGQNFSVLRSIYQNLYEQGKRFVYLGNIDNLGFTVHPVALALLALSGKQAGFDFSFKTPVDVKGGILVYDQRNRLNCADIGPAISKEEVMKTEQQGTPILFNCANGLFNLEYLVQHMDTITGELPVRFSDQNKDAGMYSQAEQVTWEIIGMLDDLYVFGVDKFERFLSAKLVLETFMTSGIGLDNSDFPTSGDPAHDLKSIAKRLYQGLSRKLEGDYGMKLDGSHWVPLEPQDFEKA